MLRILTALLFLTQILPRVAQGLICAGDCNLDSRVTTEELVVATLVASGDAPLTTCSAADVDNDQQLSAGELTAATESALFGCPYAPRSRPAAEEGCSNGFLAGELVNLADTNVVPAPLALTQGQGRLRSIFLPGGDPGFELTGTFSLCPNTELSRIVTLAVRTPGSLLPGEYFIDATLTRLAYAEAQGGANAFVRGWHAEDGVIVVDELTETSVLFHTVGAVMLPDNQNGPLGTFTVLANGGLDTLAP